MAGPCVESGFIEWKGLVGKKVRAFWSSSRTRLASGVVGVAILLFFLLMCAANASADSLESMSWIRRMNRQPDEVSDGDGAGETHRGLLFLRACDPGESRIRFVEPRGSRRIGSGEGGIE